MSKLKILSFTPVEAKFIKSLPLHHSQEIILENEDECCLQYLIHSTYDFIMEILARGRKVKVIEPKTSKQLLFEPRKTISLYKNLIFRIGMGVNKLKVDFFGEGISIKKGIFTEELFERMQLTALKLKQPLEEALIDPYFYYALKDNKVKSIEDIGEPIVNGLINTNKSRIEIWYQGKKVQKLTMNNLNDQFLLFPLFQTITKNIELQNNLGLYVKYLDIGLIARYELMVDNFSLDNLEFHLINYDGKIILSKVAYENEFMKLKKKDTLITYQNGFSIF